MTALPRIHALSAPTPASEGARVELRRSVPGGGSVVVVLWVRPCTCPPLADYPGDPRRNGMGLPRAMPVPGAIRRSSKKPDGVVFLDHDWDCPAKTLFDRRALSRTFVYDGCDYETALHVAESACAVYAYEAELRRPEVEVCFHPWEAAPSDTDTTTTEET